MRSESASALARMLMATDKGVQFASGYNGKQIEMKLTRLRLIGFKSFVEPTDFLIEPGLTGVVGPNGCGKSNLVEALRWVMARRRTSRCAPSKWKT